MTSWDVTKTNKTGPNSRRGTEHDEKGTFSVGEWKLSDTFTDGTVHARSSRLSAESEEELSEAECQKCKWYVYGGDRNMIRVWNIEPLNET